MVVLPAQESQDLLVLFCSYRVLCVQYVEVRAAKTRLSGFPHGRLCDVDLGGQEIISIVGCHDGFRGWRYASFRRCLSESVHCGGLQWGEAKLASDRGAI